MRVNVLRSLLGSFALLPLLLAMAACSSPQMVVKPPAIKAELSQDPVDPRIVHFKLNNQSSMYLVFFEPASEAERLDSFQVRTSDGRQMQYHGEEVNRIEVITKEDFVIMPPKSEFVNKANIGKAFRLPSSSGLRTRRVVELFRFGFYNSDADANAAVHRMLTGRNKTLPEFTGIDTPWIELK